MLQKVAVETKIVEKVKKLDYDTILYAGGLSPVELVFVKKGYSTKSPYVLMWEERLEGKDHDIMVRVFNSHNIEAGPLAEEILRIEDVDISEYDIYLIDDQALSHEVYKLNTSDKSWYLVEKGQGYA